MGYHNLNTGQLRERRRQQRRQDVAAPVGQTGIGHGDGLRIYDEGRIILDGPELQVILQLIEGRGFITYHAMNRAGLRADPAFWGDENVFVVAGPLRDDSTAPAGYGGSNLFLYHNRAVLSAGNSGPSPASLELQDTGNAWLYTPNGFLFIGEDGQARLYNDNGQVTVHPDGAVDVFGPNGTALTMAASGTVTARNGQAQMYLNPDGGFGLSGPAAMFTGGADGGWSAGAVGKAVMQGGPNGTFGLWAGSGQNVGLNSNTTVNGTLDVTGAKNFLMDHPEQPGHTIRYGSTESPHSLIQCRGRAEVGEGGTAVITFPDHFTAIVKPDTDVDVTLQPYGPDRAWCDVPTSAGTTIHGTAGTIVAWQALAERIGGDFTVVEEGSTAPAEPVPAGPIEPPTEQETH